MRSCETCKHWKHLGAHALKGLCEARSTVVFTPGVDDKEARVRRYVATNPVDWCERWETKRRTA